MVKQCQVLKYLESKVYLLQLEIVVGKNSQHLASLLNPGIPVIARAEHAATAANMDSFGTNFVVDQMFRPFAVRDGLLVTGQQQNSGAAAARLVIEALGR